MKYVTGTWVGNEERETVDAGIVRPGQSVTFPEYAAKSFEEQGLFKPDSKTPAPKVEKEVKHVRSED